MLNRTICRPIAWTIGRSIPSWWGTGGSSPGPGGGDQWIWVDHNHVDADGNQMVWADGAGGGEGEGPGLAAPGEVAFEDGQALLNEDENTRIEYE